MSDEPGSKKGRTESLREGRAMKESIRSSLISCYGKTLFPILIENRELKLTLFHLIFYVSFFFLLLNRKKLARAHTYIHSYSAVCASRSHADLIFT